MVAAPFFFLLKRIVPLGALLVPLFFCIACGNSGVENEDSVDNSLNTPSTDGENPASLSKEKIKINQIGYLSEGEKFAIVPAVEATQFELRKVEDDSVAYSADLSPTMEWSLAGDVKFKQADLSEVEEPGEYYLFVEGVKKSDAFEIGSNLFAEIHDSALKSYYLNRAGLALTENLAGKWARPAGHPDNQVLVHASAASETRPAGTELSSPKGWYDAGDFGKYTVNSGISVYTLLTAYEHFESFYSQRNINIPESGNSVPDILDEVKWNLDWMKTMQDEDGAVYHKLAALEWPSSEMPHQDSRQRYVIGRGTAATLNFAATMAQASRIYSNFEAEFPGFAASCLKQAEAAWAWARANPEKVFDPGSDGNNGSGAYGDRSFAGEFAWAAAELFLSTEKAEYLNTFQESKAVVNIPSWADTNTLAYISLVFGAKDKMNSDAYRDLRADLINAAEVILQEYQSNPYKVPMTNSDFVWGSNGNAGNKALILLQAYRETTNPVFKAAAFAVLDYLLGRNPTDYAFVTGFGYQSPLHIHHRQSEADDIEEPLPGFVAGGPQSDNNADNCSYPSSSPATSYTDDWCSYSTNEIAINWNAPLVYLLGAVNYYSSKESNSSD